MTHHLSLGEEEELFGATLDTVHVIIHVEEANGQRDSVVATSSVGLGSAYLEWGYPGIFIIY